tara:strand:- start:391 stop:762 length:372 start_codon:yes stop_codon:yes gene_type:complete
MKNKYPKSLYRWPRISLLKREILEQKKILNKRASFSFFNSLSKTLFGADVFRKKNQECLARIEQLQEEILSLEKEIRPWSSSETIIRLNLKKKPPSAAQLREMGKPKDSALQKWIERNRKDAK